MKGFSRVIHVRLPEVMVEKVKKRCDGIGVSEWVRGLIVNALGDPSAKVDPVVRSYAEKSGKAKKVCAACGKESENWGYDMGGKVRCSECAVV